MAQRMSYRGSGVGFHRKGERERMLFIAFAGLAFSLLIIMLVVLNYKSDAVARNIKNETNETAAQTTVGTVTLLAFERPVSAGTKLSDIKLKEVYWPRSQVPAGAVFDAAEIRNQFAKINIPAGVPVQRDQLVSEAVQTTLPLRSGYRAVSIDVDATSGIEGHALPGTQVDVLLTYSENQALTTKVIVQNARVLSYGGNVESAERMRASGRYSDASRLVSHTLTLEVTPQDALKIQTARQLGRLSLVMRALEDNLAPSVTELNQFDIGDKRPARQSQPARCTKKGVVRMEGKEYIVDCDGSIRQMAEGEAP